MFHPYIRTTEDTVMKRLRMPSMNREGKTLLQNGAYSRLPLPVRGKPKGPYLCLCVTSWRQSERTHKKQVTVLRWC